MKIIYTVFLLFLQIEKDIIIYKFFFLEFRFDFRCLFLLLENEEKKICFEEVMSDDCSTFWQHTIHIRKRDMLFRYSNSIAEQNVCGIFNSIKMTYINEIFYDSVLLCSLLCTFSWRSVMVNKKNFNDVPIKSMLKLLLVTHYLCFTSKWFVESALRECLQSMKTHRNLFFVYSYIKEFKITYLMP